VGTKPEEVMLSHWKVAKINPGRRGNHNYSLELWMRCMTNRRGKTLLLYFVVLLVGLEVSGTRRIRVSSDQIPLRALSLT
jgi:hypothetical protein